ncbi:unnamed protein product, partial [Ectocarpus fasciculatus]
MRSNRPELRRAGGSLRKVRRPRPRDSGLSFEPVRFAGTRHQCRNPGLCKGKGCDLPRLCQGRGERLRRHPPLQVPQGQAGRGPGHLRHQVELHE